MSQARVLGAFVALAAPAGVAAQGSADYYNVESPQTRAIAVATLDGHDYLLACNTPDNTVELYDTVGNVHLQTVRTGAEPVAVTWDPATACFYTANFLGDSVSAFALVRTGTGAPRARMARTEWVGDEPLHVGLLPGGALAVTLSSSSALAVIDPVTLLPLIPAVDLLDRFAAPTRALKEPRTIATAGNVLVVLGHRGGKLGVSFAGTYDLDLWCVDLIHGTVGTLGGLGTTHFNMAVASNGDLFVVGADAQLQLVGEQRTRSAPTGFVQTMLYRVTGAGGAGAQVLARDLNRQTTAGGQPGNPVPHDQALAQVTDVAIWEPDAGTRKLYLCAFGSDRIGVLSPSGPLPEAWPVVARIPIDPVGAIPHAMAGPRALAVKYPRPSVPGDPGARVYVLNRLDHSISVIDPTRDVRLTTFALPRDPTPLHIRNGRRFLYDARLSGNGFGSCASCHVDGRSDWLPWALGDGVTVPFDPALDGGIVGPPAPLTWPGDKGRLVTQSLQGLLNTEVEAAARPYFSTEPLHWRADRARFADFNQTFVSLLGGSQLPPGQLDAFRAAVMSIHYPPNPEQDLARRPRGTFGTPDRNDGSGAARGLKLFCIRPLTSASPAGALSAGRSCIQCHEPPDGGDNLVSMFDNSISTPGVRQPLESSALRLLRQKERTLERSPGTLSPIVTSMSGLGHEGALDSINAFVGFSFGNDLQGPNEAQDVIQLTREWDTGTGPLVGCPLPVDRANRGQMAGAVAFFEAQARLANSGLAAWGRIAGAERGFFYDLSGTTPVWREEPGSATFATSGLLALIVSADDILVFEATPLGSERRRAWPAAGAPSPITGPPPDRITLEPMPTNTFWQDLPRLTANFDIAGPNPFVWQTAAPHPAALRSKRIAQKGLIQDGVGLGLGIAQPRHEAPRRIAVAGDNIRHGASLMLLIPLNPAAPPPAIVPPFTVLRLAIHPTGRVDAAGRRVWETCAELDPHTSHLLMLGGPAAPNVGNLISRAFTQEPPARGTFDPANWNRYWVAVINADGTAGATFGERLRLR